MRNTIRWEGFLIARFRPCWTRGRARKHRRAKASWLIRRHKRDDMSVPVPKYYLITNILRQTFAKYERGDRVPSECELAAQFGVSRVTLQRALAQLVADGIVVRM